MHGNNRINTDNAASLPLNVRKIRCYTLPLKKLLYLIRLFLVTDYLYTFALKTYSNQTLHSYSKLMTENFSIRREPRQRAIVAPPLFRPYACARTLESADFAEMLARVRRPI